MKFHTILALFGSYFLFHGCKPIRSVSSVKHDAGRLALNSYASNWIEVPLSKWFQMFPKQDFSLNEGPLQKRLQTWANAMDSAARRTPWGQKNMKHVPHPVVVIISSSAIEAYAMGVSVSYAVRFKSLASLQNHQQIERGQCAFHTGDSFVLMNFSDHEIVPGNPALLNEVVKQTQNRAAAAGNSCKPIFKNDGSIAAEGCGPYSQNFEASAYCPTQTANVITISSQMLKSFSEDQSVSILAHELGHYYKAHAASVANTLLDSGFFYWDKDTALAARPTPITDKATVANAKKVLGEILEEQSNPGRAPNSIYHPLVVTEILTRKVQTSDFASSNNASPLISMGSLIAAKCRTAHPVHSDCDHFESLVLQWGEDKSPYFSSWTESEHQQYRMIEQNLAKFGPQIGVVDTMNNPNEPSALPWQFLSISALRSESFSPQGGMSLDAYLRMAGDRLDERRAKRIARAQDLVAKRIGWYTYEQEADEISAELLASVGVSPRHASGALLEMLEIMPQTSNEPVVVPYEQCAKLYANRFGFESKIITPVFQGNWLDPHHDTCFRVFNIERDIHAHKYKVISENRPSFASSWETEIQNLPQPQNSQPGLAASPASNNAPTIQKTRGFISVH